MIVPHDEAVKVTSRDVFSLRCSRRALLVAGTGLPLLATSPLKGGSFPYRTTRVTAPFAMPPTTEPDFAGARRFVITDFGATLGDNTRNTEAIRKAIIAANRAGRGIVVVPRGEWLTGPVHLLSNVNLHLEPDAVLLFSEQPSDYLPAVRSSWEGLECYNYSPLIYAYQCENVAVSGEGTIRAKMDIWKRWFERPKPHLDALVRLNFMAVLGRPVAERQLAVGESNLRPQFIQFNRCANVLVEDVHIKDSPFWTIHPLLCKNVVIRRVQIEAHGVNNDGVDPEMSQNVLIEDCVFDQGDDAIAIKAGRDQDAWRIGVPCRNVVMRRCRVKQAHELVAIGSELSAGIENVFVHDCTIDAASHGDRANVRNILFVKTNERRGGYVRNIHVSNISAGRIEEGVLNVDTDVLYQWRTLAPTYERRLTSIDGLFVGNVRVDEAAFITSIKGQAEMPVRRVRVDRISANKVLKSPTMNSNVVGFELVP